MSTSSSSSSSSSHDFNQVLLPTEWQSCGEIFPATCKRDGSVDLYGLSSMLYSIRRRAWNKGWAPPSAGSPKDSRIFMASNLLCLCNVGVYDKTKDSDLDIKFGGRAAVAHVGSSSYSFYSETEAIDADDASGNTKCFVGFQLIALVSINGETRRPQKLLDENRLVLENAVKEGNVPAKIEALGVTPLGRLPAHEVITKSSATAHTFKHRLSLRPYVDFDFNQHVNQGQYLQWINDTLTAMAAGEQRANFQRTSGKNSSNARLADDANLSYLSSTLRVARMDYVEEVVNREGTVLVSLHCGVEVDKLAADSIGPEFLKKLGKVPRSSEHVPLGNIKSGVDFSLMSELRLAYYTITDESNGRVVNRGFIAFDAIPCELEDQKVAAAEGNKKVGEKHAAKKNSTGSSSWMKKIFTYSAALALGGAVGAWFCKKSKL